jgi:hypothetical protein
MPLEPSYQRALEALAKACTVYRDLTGRDVVLVGGAATAIYSSGLFPSGDFDVIASADEALDDALRQSGFLKEDRAGFLQVGYYHPEHPAFGFQQVSSVLFDGRADQQRLVRIIVTAKDDAILLPSIEDMIADRLAQYRPAVRSILQGLSKPGHCSGWQTGWTSPISPRECSTKVATWDFWSSETVGGFET